MKKESLNKAEPVKDEKDYEAENAARTLMEAAEIQGNPELHSKAIALLGKKKKAINSIAGLKAKRQELLEEEEGEED